MARAGEVVQRFLDRLDEVVERCASGIWESVPAYAEHGEPLLADVRRGLRERVGTLGRVLAEGRRPHREVLEAIGSVGARRAEAGIPLEDVLRAHRIVSRVCWDVLAEECRRLRVGLEDALTIGSQVLQYTDEISTMLADAYARAQRAIVREQEGARREFLSDLLHGVTASGEDLLARARSFGYDLSLSYVALVGVGPSQARKEALLADAASRVTGRTSAEPIVLQKAEHTIALVPAEPPLDPDGIPAKLLAELGDGWRFGTGAAQVGLEGIRRAYIEAREALEIGTLLELAGPVYRFGDLLLYHFLRSEPGLVDLFVAETLGPLIEYDRKRRGELTKTLETYFAVDESVKKTGEALFSHPHTVTYRLRQIEKLTETSLREPEDKLRLQLALRAHRLSRARRDAERKRSP